MRLDADNHEHDENLKIMREQRGYLHMVSLLAIRSIFTFKKRCICMLKLVFVSAFKIYLLLGQYLLKKRCMHD